MRFFTIFASRNDTNDIEDIIVHVFQNGFKVVRKKNEYTIQLKRLFGKNRIMVRVDSEDSNPDYFSNNIPGMMRMYDQLSFQEERLKTMVLTQISVINTMIAIETEKDYGDDYVELFHKLLKQVYGIGFISNGTLIGMDGQVIVYPDGTSGPSKFTPHACSRKIKDNDITSTEGEERKQKSIIILQEKQIPYIEWLPQLPPLSRIQLRTREEIAKRTVALLLVIQYACDVAQERDLEASKEFVLELLNKYSVDESLTDQEREFLKVEQPDQREAIQIAWQYEAHWVLLWALGLVNTLEFPTEICNSRYAIQLVSDCSSFNAFYQKTVLRSGEEILDEADLIYRLHWACVNDRVSGRKVAAGIQESIVVERRRGLFWLIGHRNEDWNCISMDT